MKIVQWLVKDGYRKTGIVCPMCQSSKKVALESNGTTYWVACITCGSEGPESNDVVYAIAGWYCLTGGPIPGEISPLRGMTPIRIDTPSKWWLNPVDRNIETVTDWLNTEVKERT